MLNRNDIKNTAGYRRLISLGGVSDDSGPVIEKKGAFKFSRRGDYGTYHITSQGRAKRQSAGPAFSLVKLTCLR